MVARRDEKRLLEEVLYDKLEKKHREKINRPFTWTGLAKEIFIIGRWEGQVINNCQAQPEPHPKLSWDEIALL